MVRIRTLIVDDEPLARENLRLRLQGHPDFEIIGECDCGAGALAAIEDRRPDLVFLDIRMPDMSGFDVITRLRCETQPLIVFVTAFDRYALDAFRVHALDYLLKPFDDDRFAETLAACRERLRTESEAPAASEPVYRLSVEPGASGTAWNSGADLLVIKGRSRVSFLKTAAVEWVEADGDYARLHCGQRTYLLRRTMSEMETRLGPRDFVRVSRSAIVNLEQVRDLVPVARGEYLVRLQTGDQVKLTRGYRERLERRLGDRL